MPAKRRTDAGQLAKWNEQGLALIDAENRHVVPVISRGDAAAGLDYPVE